MLQIQIHDVLIGSSQRGKKYLAPSMSTKCCSLLILLAFPLSFCSLVSALYCALLTNLSVVSVTYMCHLLQGFFLAICLSAKGMVPASGVFLEDGFLSHRVDQWSPSSPSSPTCGLLGFCHVHPGVG